MDSYELLLFLHFTSIIFWVGGTLLVEILAHRADRAGDAAAMRKLFDELNALDPVFIPATLLALVSGVLLVIDGPWSFDALWIILGLSGFGFIYVYGFLYLDPQVKRLRAMIERDGGVGPQAHAHLRRFFVLWRVETVVLLLVVFDMTIKPTAEDVGTLALMAAVFAVASAYLLFRAQSIAAAGRKAGEVA